MNTAAKNEYQPHDIAANDDTHGGIVVAIGKQVPANGKTVPQPHHTKAEHIALANMEALANFVTDKAVTLPTNPTDADRKAAKAAVGYFVLGGLKSGGSDAPIIGEAARLDPKNDIHRRWLGNINPCRVMPFDLDACPRALLDALTGGELALSDEAPADLRAVLDGYSAVAYTTPSHRDDAPRLRLLVEMAEPVAPERKAEICIRLEHALMNAVGGVRVVDGEPGQWTLNGERVKFDRSVNSPNQMLYKGHGNALVWLTEGEPVDVDSLPPVPDYEADSAKPAKARAEGYGTPENLSPLREYLYANGLAEPHDDRTDNIICPWQDEHSSGHDFDNSTVLKTAVDRTRERGYCSHAGCQARLAELKKEKHGQQYGFFRQLGVPESILSITFGGIASADDFEQLAPVTGDLLEREHALAFEPGARGEVSPASREPLLAVGGRAAFLTHKAADPRVPAFAQWNGNTGDARRDKERQEVADLYGLPLKFIPPRIIVKESRDGKVTYKGTTHSDNLRWALYKNSAVISRNLMTWKIEVFNPRTGEQLAASDAETRSFIFDALADEGLNEKLYVNHFDSLAANNSYHPIKLMFHGQQWDGVPRVQRVLDCVPVADGDEYMRNTLLKAMLAASMAAIDEGSVSMKIVPVLYSRHNDWFKTGFLRRMFDITPGSFREGVGINPEKKDSVRQAVFAWFSELGELDQMTARESGPLKAFIPMPEDTWRTEFKATMDVKPRQTTFAGTVNDDAFLHDATMASRFPTISLSAPIRIDDVNAILGWELVNGKPVLTNQEKLLQFWMEIREMRRQGLTHLLSPEDMTIMKASAAGFVDKGSYYSALLAALAEHEKTTNAGDSNPFAGDDLTAGEWFTPTAAAKGIGAGVANVSRVGRALTQLHTDGALEKKRTKAGQAYRVNKGYFDE